MGSQGEGVIRLGGHMGGRRMKEVYIQLLEGLEKTEQKLQCKYGIFVCVWLNFEM